MWFKDKKKPAKEKRLPTFAYYIIAALIIAVIFAFGISGVIDNYMIDLNYWDVVIRWFFPLLLGGLAIAAAILLIWHGEMG
ncbi:MAG: hypothetical protein ACFFBH_14365 [Promethearchaeota archaeon]